MSETTAGVLPPVETWHPQVRRWIHAAWEQAGGLEGGRLSLSQLVRAMWSAGDPWSRAYRHLFAGAPAPPPAPTAVAPDEDVFYAGEPELVELLETASRLGAGRIHPWAVLSLVAERTRGSAQRGSPGLHGVRTAPVEAHGEGTIVRAQRHATPDDALAWAGGRQLVAILVDERLSSTSERYATPYVEGRFHLIADDAWVLRQPGAQAPFWVLEGVAPDSADCLVDALRETRRMVPGFVPWLPLKAGLAPDHASRLDALLSPLRTLPRLLLTTDPQTAPSDTESDGLLVALDAATGGIQDGPPVAPVLADHPDQDDILGHVPLAAGLARALADAATDPPFTLAVLGPSGSGRSDLLARLAAQWVGVEAPEEGAPPALRVLRLSAPEVEGPLPDAVWAALHGVDALPPEAAPAPPPGPPPPTEAARALRLFLPGARSGSPTGATALARLGGALAVLGGAGVLAAPPDWTAFLPAALLGVGACLGAAGAGAGLLSAEPPDRVDLPDSPTSSQDWSDLQAHLDTAPSARSRLRGCRRLLVLLDDLDRVPEARAAELLAAVPALQRSTELPPLVTVLAGTVDTLDAACPDDHPLDTLVQVPLWLTPVRERVASHLLGAWTGLPAPRVAHTPRLRAVQATTQAPPAPVPIHIEPEDTREVGPADLDALLAVTPLVPPTARAWKRLVNQTRLLRPQVPPGTPASAVATWLALAAADPSLPVALRPRLAPGCPVAEAITDLRPDLAEAVRRVPETAWPDAETLADSADAVLRWTFAGPWEDASRAGPGVPAEARRSA